MSDTPNNGQGLNPEQQELVDHMRELPDKLAAALTQSNVSDGETETDVQEPEPKPTPDPEPTPEPEPEPEPKPEPEPEPTPEPEPEPTPTPTPPQGQVMLAIDPALVMRLPTTGKAWDTLLARARADWGTPNLGDLNSNHDTGTLAGALVALRTGDNEMRSKTINAIRAAYKAPLGSRTLEPGRNLFCYLQAAVLIGLQEQALLDFARTTVTKSLQGHSGSNNILETAQFASNNWGTMCIGSALAATLLLGDKDTHAKLVQAQKRWLGDVQASSVMKFTTTNWHDDPKNPRGINAPGGRAAGAQPEDMRRGSEYSEVPKATGYAYEALQGVHVAALISLNNGFDAFAFYQQAILRAYDYLMSIRWLPQGDDEWQAYIMHAQCLRLRNSPLTYKDTSGTTKIVPVNPAASWGKNFGYAAWLYQDVEQQVRTLAARRRMLVGTLEDAPKYEPVP